MNKKDILKEFQQIPGVGKIIAQDFYNIGLRSIEDLQDKDPEKLFLDLCKFQNAKVDRCMLYVFRCAVEYSITKNKHLKWWDFKDF
ncbi:MAG: hypothetical protein JXA94_04840 [Parachlamydiales bacterium]|nr:hypothetical protein [Parachlamydiales bacterium]